MSGWLAKADDRMASFADARANGRIRLGWWLAGVAAFLLRRWGRALILDRGELMEGEAGSVNHMAGAIDGVRVAVPTESNVYWIGRDPRPVERDRRREERGR